MEPQIIGIKQLHKELKKISMKAQAGQSYIVVKNSRPVFRVEPFGKLRPKYTIKDLEKIRFKSDDKNLSKHIDKILYG